MTTAPEQGDAAADHLALEPLPGDTESALTTKALGGVAWNWAGSLIVVAAQIASTIVTARLLLPAEFGVYATAQAAAGLAGYLTFTAVGPGLQRRSSLGEHTAGTAMIISLGAAGVVTVALWFGAPLWARAWEIPDATSTVRALAGSLFLMSTTVVPLALIARRLQFARVAIIETVALVVGLAVGVGLAIGMHSALALALGQVAGAAALLLMACLALRTELKLGFDREDARELLTFSSQVGGLSLFTYLSYTVPSWFAARTFGAAALGLYSRASLVVALPSEYALRGIFKVIYPLYGKVREDLRRTKTLLDEALTLTTGVLWPLFGLVAGGAPVIVAVILGPRWDDAAPLLALFALTASAWVPCGLLTNAAEALGWMRIIASRQLAFFCAILASVLTVYAADLSITWLLVGVAGAEWAAYLLTLRPFVARGFMRTGDVMRRQLVHGGVAVLALGAAAGCSETLDHAHLAVQVAGQLAVGIGVYALVLFGRGWFPATSVLARRLGVEPGHGIVRAAWAALR